MLRAFVALLAFSAPLAVAGTTSSATTLPKLVGTVGKRDAFVIKMTDAKGNTLKNVKAGKYKLVFWDLSKRHTFHFKGPGFELRTKPVSFKGLQSWAPVILMKNSVYRFWCDVHKSRMNGSFKVVARG